MPAMTPTTSCAFLITVLLAFSDLLCAGLNAQASGSILSGTVVDVSQAAIPNVRVTLTNVSTGVARTVSTDPTGLYTLANLPPASYEMTAVAMGFTTQVRTDITLDLGAKLVLNVVMEAGDPNQVIRVSVSGRPTDSASSAAGGNVSSSTVLDSPLNGRDWTQLATLQAGVTGVQTGTAEGRGNMERGFGAALSISGARPDQNSYRLDGVSINDYSNGAPGSVLGDNLGVDAVEQFSVLGSNYPAVYGRTTGGVINAVTRSGTNAFHGSVYEFLRNSTLDARNYFTTKLDHKFSELDTFSGSLMRDNSKVVQPDAFDELLANVVSRRQLVTLHEQHIFNSKFLNAARFGFNRAVAIEGGVSRVMNPLLADAAFGFIRGQFVGEVQAVPGITNFTGGLNAQRPGTRSSSRNLFWNSFQWTDDVFLIKGVHALQFGVLVERMQDNLLLTSRTNGVFKFSSLSDFLSNRPRNFVGLLPIPIPTFGIRQTLFGTYVQDDIRLRRNLTINTGFRYEMATVPSEAHGRLSNLLPLTDSEPPIDSVY